MTPRNLSLSIALVFVCVLPGQSQANRYKSKKPLAQNAKAQKKSQAKTTVANKSATKLGGEKLVPANRLAIQAIKSRDLPSLMVNVNGNAVLKMDRFSKATRGKLSEALHDRFGFSYQIDFGKVPGPERVEIVEAIFANSSLSMVKEASYLVKNSSSITVGKESITCHMSERTVVLKGIRGGYTTTESPNPVVQWKRVLERNASKLETPKKSGSQTPGMRASQAIKNGNLGSLMTEAGGVPMLNISQFSKATRTKISQALSDSLGFGYQVQFGKLSEAERVELTNSIFANVSPWMLKEASYAVGRSLSITVGKGSLDCDLGNRIVHFRQTRGGFTRSETTRPTWPLKAKQNAFF